MSADPHGTAQIELFYEHVYDALKAAVQACGGSKVVAAALWPKKPLAEGQRDLLDALNRDRARKLDPEEMLFVLALARRAGFHGAMRWICDFLSYTAVQPLTQEEELAVLQRRFVDAAADMRVLAERIERRTKEMTFDAGRGPRADGATVVPVASRRT